MTACLCRQFRRLRNLVKRIAVAKPWMDPEDQELARREAAAEAAAEALLHVSCDRPSSGCLCHCLQVELDKLLCEQHVLQMLVQWHGPSSE